MRHSTDETLAPPANEAMTMASANSDKESDESVPDILDSWQSAARGLHPVIQDFKLFIDKTARVTMLFHEMLGEVPIGERDPIGVPQIREGKALLGFLSSFMQTAPEFAEHSPCGLPIIAMLTWPMCTASGYAFFLDTEVNAHIRRILNEWGRFLVSPASRHVLHSGDNGWFGKAAMERMPNFDETYVCDPTAPYRGFKSWNDFFTRRLRPGMRPVECSHDASVIVHPCESIPYKVATQVQASDVFWIKSQPYSLRHMLADNPRYRAFVGGTVYQAFLSSTNYHRWHSPVDGRVVELQREPGTYFSQPRAAGYDPTGLVGSLGYLSAVAVRAIAYIVSDNPAIGLMCFMAIGLAEVSSCEWTVETGQNVRKGDELGMFHFGGSTMCMVFRPSVQLAWNLPVQPTTTARKANIPVNAAIARVVADGLEESQS